MKCLRIGGDYGINCNCVIALYLDGPTESQEARNVCLRRFLHELSLCLLPIPDKLFRKLVHFAPRSPESIQTRICIKLRCPMI